MPQIVFTMQKQLQSHWCWLATAASVLSYYKKKRMTQGDVLFKVLVDKKHGDRYDFALRKNKGVNFPGKVVHALNSGGLSCATVHLPTSWNSVEECEEETKPLFEGIKRYINSGKPVIAGLRARGSTSEGHYIVIVGYNNDQIIWKDPQRGDVVRKAPNFTNFLLNLRRAAYVCYLVYIMQ